MVITKDSDSFNPGSSPGRTFFLVGAFLNLKKIKTHAKFLLLFNL